MADDPRDDLSIPNADRLFRRVRRNQLLTEQDGSQRPTSAVFKNPELSVNIESLMIEQRRPPEDTLTKFPDDYLTAITAGDVRAYKYPIVKDIDPPTIQLTGWSWARKQMRSPTPWFAHISGS